MFDKSRKQIWSNCKVVSFKEFQEIDLECELFFCYDDLECLKNNK